MKIALDAMGGDYAPQNIVAGAVLALREYATISKLLLTGDAPLFAQGNSLWIELAVGNLLSNVCTPTYLANTAKKLAKDLKLKVEVLGEAQIAAFEKLGRNTKQ